MNQSKLYRTLSIPYYLWIIIFVLAPMVLLLITSFRGTDGSWTLNNYIEFFTSSAYLRMSVNSLLIALVITLLTFMVAYPFAYFLAKSKRRDLLYLLVLLPTWINLLLKMYAFIGILGVNGPLVKFFNLINFGPDQLLFTNLAFIIVAVYVELPFMVIPLYNSIVEIPDSIYEASRDLGGNEWQTLTRIVLPMSQEGIRSGIQTVFIPSLSLFMLSRIIGGGRIITLGTAVEQHFLVSQNWGMGATIGVVLMIFMALVMYLTRSKKGGIISE